MIKLLIIFCIFTTILNAREIGQIEITTEEGIEVYQKEKYYLLKSNVEIKSDNFNLKADLVKAFFDKDLYDITNIQAEGNVILKSTKEIQAMGNKIDFNAKNENIHIEGKESYLKNKTIIMKSDKLIEVNNDSGEFKLSGFNSEIITTNLHITGTKIEGNYINVDGENIVEKLMVEDKTQIFIKTETLDMYALKAEYDKKNNIIELFDNVKIFRNEEQITGDYAKINTLDESYKITSNKTNKVRVLLKQN